MNGTEAHEARMTAVLRLTRSKDRFGKLAVEFLLGRTVKGRGSSGCATRRGRG